MSSMVSGLTTVAPCANCASRAALCMKLPSRIRTIEGGRMVPNVPALHTMPLANLLS
jgi:hypothetical protein